MAYTTIDDPEAYFQIKNYTGEHGSGAGTSAITFDGTTNMQPDLVWIKTRSNSANHQLHHSLATEAYHYFKPNDSAAETTSNTSALQSFDSDGFTLGSDGVINEDGYTYVAWCWKESTTAGLDIIHYTGTGSGTTVSHGLSAKPGWMLAKNRGATGGWMMWHQNLPDTGDKVLYFHLTSAMQDEQMFNDTEPTSSVFSVSADSNLSSNTYTAFIWAEKQGFSKFGTYEGNGDANGPYVWTGFKPKLVIFKSIDSTAGAYIVPSKTDCLNGNTYWAYVYSSTTESNAAFVDFHANGFKLRKNDDINNSETYVYMAFAEAPFVNSKGVPCTAR